MDGEFKVSEDAIVEGIGVQPSDIHPIVARFISFIEEDDVKTEMEEFCAKFCADFAEIDEDDEQSLKTHEIFQKFEKMFEGTVERFLEGQGMSTMRFFSLCQQAQEESKETDDCLQMALGLLDYKEFVKFMKREERATMNAEDVAADMGL
ncbi:unnamed protein product [Heterosigma akashiwo]|uniref:BART domain-containing protein n=1 Tax=Heterosigma akashiwo TaxID=2829 RepID=A0A6S9E4M2_HETAK|mmetsp:Transcript_32325/g.56284  ORF Transcript_32325/g.56284 Transcript_32325/m.56284 type:complete len:150 (+) Transcript_32325:139-588(+)